MLHCTLPKVPLPVYLQCGADKEVLLLEAQLLALIGAVIRVQHTGQGLSTLLAKDSLHTQEERVSNNVVSTDRIPL